MSVTLVERVGFEETVEETWSCSLKEFSALSVNDAGEQLTASEWSAGGWIDKIHS